MNRRHLIIRKKAKSKVEAPKKASRKPAPAKSRAKTTRKKASTPK